MMEDEEDVKRVEEASEDYPFNTLSREARGM